MTREYALAETTRQLGNARDTLKTSKNKAVLTAAANKIDYLVAVQKSLCGPTREQVERMRGEWQSIHGLSEYYCSRCGEEFEIHAYDKEKYQFCPHCSRPLKDEAVDMMLKRMEEIYK